MKERLFLRATCQSCNLPLILMKMELTEDHDIQLAKEILGSEPYRLKP